jgi:hypothetical protein
MTKKTETKDEVAVEEVSNKVKKKTKFSLKHFVKTYRWTVAAAVVVLIALIGVSAYAISMRANQPENAQPAKKEKKAAAVKPEEPKEIPRKIDGVVVDRDKANPHLVCVMIENAAFGGVRPQSGLSKAPVVYEVIVEGGITRLMAVFMDTEDGKADVIGPVRSARDTYLEFAAEYNCPYAHAGGSFTAMLALRERDFRDIDALRERGFYRRAGKIAPHNLFVKWDDLQALAAGHEWKEKKPDYASWTFADPLAAADRPAEGATDRAVKVNIDFGGSYNVEYRYISETNTYERWNGSSPLREELDNSVITADNIVIYHVGGGDEIEGKGRINWPVTTADGGDVDIINNGKVFKGRWKKTADKERVQFVDADGKDIPLTRGNTWVEVVPEHITSSIQ